MRRRGFTLVELLAVITILAVVALIAIPLVGNSIEKSRRQTAELGMESIEKAADLYNYNQQLKGEQGSIRFKCQNGTCSSGSIILDIEGVAPEDGIVAIDENGNVTLDSIVIDGYLCKKADSGYSCVKINGKNNSSTSNSVITFTDALSSTVIDYKIYGNSIEKGLPEEYQRVEYIESTGTQYINTGFKHNQDTGFDIEFTINDDFTTNFNDYKYIFGSDYQINAVQALELYNGSTSGLFKFNKTSYNAGIKVGEKNHITLLNGVYTNHSNVTINLPKSPFSLDENLIIFALNRGNSIPSASYSSTKLYSFKLYDGEFLVRNFVPCYRKSDSEVGLYDLINGQFYTNQGTGIFNKGSDISAESLVGENVGNSFGDIVTDKNDANYGKYLIPIKLTGKNLINQENLLKNSTVVKEESGYAVSGYPTQYLAEFGLFEMIQPGVTYTLSRKISNYQQSGSGQIWLRNISNNLVAVPYHSGIKSTSFSLTKSQIDSLSVIYVYGLAANPTIYEYLQLEIGGTATDYEPYKEKTYSIYLNEPLRKTGNYVDYIDFEKGVVVRNVEEVKENGTTILRGLSTPKTTKINLPRIELFEGTNVITIDTEVSPSNSLIGYYR